MLSLVMLPMGVATEKLSCPALRNDQGRQGFSAPQTQADFNDALDIVAGIDFNLPAAFGCDDLDRNQLSTFPARESFLLSHNSPLQSPSLAIEHHGISVAPVTFSVNVIFGLPHLPTVMSTVDTKTFFRHAVFLRFDSFTRPPELRSRRVQARRNVCVHETRRSARRLRSRSRLSNRRLLARVCRRRA